MTVFQLAQRIARWTKYGSLSQMTVDDRLILLDCINAAVFNWFAAAPENMRTTTVSHLVKAPETGSVTVTKDSNILTGVTFLDYHLGASILIGADPIMNEVTSLSPTVQVLNGVRSATGDTTYSLNFDTIMLTDYKVSRIVSNPRVLDTGVELTRDDDGMRFVGAERKGAWWSSSATRELGTPTRYVIENTGLSQGDEARIMIRLDPMPSKELTVVFDAVFDASSYELDDMDGAVSITVPDQYVIPHLLPIALGELAVSPIWNEAKPVNDVISKSENMVAKIQSHLNANRGNPKNYIRTRPGF
jgi:hypothetical protein